MIDFWDETDPEKPLGVIDPNDRTPLYVSWAEWLEQEGATYTGHELFIDDVAAGSVVAGLLIEEDDFAILGGLLTMWVVGGEVGTRYAITMRVTGDVSGEVIRKDRTVYIKIKEQ